MDSQGQQQSQQPGQRDMVFCHECENEWYRDEHGLTCPECQSDFTEIIEPDHDPRVEMNDDEDDNGTELQLPFEHPLMHHNPWRNAPDPDEGDINNMRFTQTGPGTFSVTGTIYRNLGPLRGGGDDEEPRRAPMTPMGQNFLSMLQSIIGPGGATNNRQQNPTPAEAGSNRDERGQDSPGGREGSPDPRQEPGVHRTQGVGPGGRFTYTSTARIFPRDANNPQPNIQPVDDLHNLIGTLLGGLDGGNGAQGEGNRPGQPQATPLHPLAALFATFMNPGLAHHGDFVYTQEAMDRVISQLMEQNTAGNAPGPASQEAINALPKKIVTVEMLGTDGKAECSICMEEVNIGEEVTLLPCKHWFHGPCISAWLSEHDTCPHCRQGIMKDSNNGSSGTSGAGNGSGSSGMRGDSSGPSDDSHSGNSSDPSSSSSGGTPGPMPGSFNEATGTRQNPLVIPSSPEQHRFSSPPLVGPHAQGGGFGERLRRGLFGAR